MQYMDGVCVFSSPISPLMSVIFDDICTLCYYHNQIGTMNQWTFLIFRSWSDGMRWICYNVLIGSGNGYNLAIMMHHIDSTYTIVACGDHNTHRLYRVAAIKQTMTKRAGDLGMRRSLRECQVQSSQLYHTILYTLHNNGALHAIQQTFLHLSYICDHVHAWPVFPDITIQNYFNIFWNNIPISIINAYRFFWNRYSIYRHAIYDFDPSKCKMATIDFISNLWCGAPMHYKLGLKSYRTSRESCTRFKLCCVSSLQWRHDGRDCDSNHQRLDCILNRLFRRRSKKIWKLRVTGFCEENSPGDRWIPFTNGQ